MSCKEGADECTAAEEEDPASPPPLSSHTHTTNCLAATTNNNRFEFPANSLRPSVRSPLYLLFIPRAKRRGRTISGVEKLQARRYVLYLPIREIMCLGRKRKWLSRFSLASRATVYFGYLAGWGRAQLISHHILDATLHRVWGSAARSPFMRTDSSRSVGPFIGCSVRPQRTGR